MNTRQKAETIIVRVDAKTKAALVKKAKDRAALIGMVDNFSMSDFIRYLIASHPEMKGK